jgi:zinc protease
MRRISLILVLIATCSVAWAQPATTPKKGTQKGLKPEANTMANKPALAAPQKITSVEGITEYRLQNGLRVLMFPDQSKQTITVNITYMVGSKHENYGETGMAHLLEHLVFKGTPKHPNIPQELTEHGASPNGTTWYDRTNYFETFNATEENLKWALDLEADRMINSYIAKKDLDTEMTVVRNEFEMGENDPSSVLEERVTSTAFLWHNYGKSTIGSRADLENVPIDRLQAFYRKYYQPDNAVLVVAGKIDESKTLEMINQQFGTIPKPAREIPATYTSDPTQDGERTVTLRRTGDVQVVTAAYHIPAGTHPDFAPLQVLARVLGSPPSSRLHKSLIDTKKASQVRAYTLQFKDPFLLFVGAEVLKEKSLDEAKAALLATMTDVVKTPPSKEEVDRAKNEILKQIELSFNSSQSIALQLTTYAGIGDWRMLFLTRDRVKAVTTEDVARVAATYLKDDNRTLGVFIPTDKPERAEIPSSPDVEALVKDYKGNAAVAAGEAFDPAPANIESRTLRSDLPNGAKLALLPKKTRGESVEVRLMFRFGNEKSVVGKGQAGEFAAMMLNKGTSKHTRQQLKDEFDRLKANVNIFGSATLTSVNITTTRPNLAEVLRLAGEVLKDPSFPADELEKLKSEQLAQIESSKSEPQAIVFRDFSRHISPYEKSDPRYTPTFDEKVADIKAVTLDEIKKYYKDTYGVTSGTTLSVVGDFDAAEMKSLMMEIFGSWKSASPYNRLPAKLFPVTAMNKAVETPDKANAWYVSGYNFEMNDQHPDYPAVLLGNYMLGGGFLNSRLAVRIRQKEGISYGVGSNFGAGTLDPVASFSTYAIYAPENLTRLEQAFQEEINKVITEGFTADEVKAAQSGWLQSRTVSRAQDGGLSSTLANYLFIKRDLMWDESLEKKVAALTPEAINAAMKKHLDPSKINVIKAGDFAKAKK